MSIQNLRQKLTNLSSWVGKYGVGGVLRQMKMTKDLATGELKGVDIYGNKYYENLSTNVQGRHRYVVYANPKDVNASSVPAEWHGWLHHVTDAPSNDSASIAFKLKHQPKEMSRMGNAANYLPAGHYLKGQTKKKYTAWGGSAKPEVPVTVLPPAPSSSPSPSSGGTAAV